MVLLGYIKEVATVAQALSTLATRRQLHTLHCIVVVSGDYSRKCGQGFTLQLLKSSVDVAVVIYLPVRKSININHGGLEV